MGKYSYKQDYLDLGFTSIKDHVAEKLQRVVCFKALSHESLKKNKLKRHLETKHPQHVKKSHTFFQYRETELIRSRISSETDPALLAYKQATLASNIVSLRIRREMKLHAIGEKLVKPAVIDIARLTWGDNVASKLQSVSLSNDTVKSRIAHLSLNVKNQVVVQMKKSGKWSYQLDESTNTGKNAQLMIYVRYKGDLNLEEEFLFWTPQTTTATGADIFNVVDNFQQQWGIYWETEVESRTQGSRPRTQKNIRGQGQPFRGQNLSRPRTGMLEAKAKDQRHRRKCSPKKKVFKNFFQAISNSFWLPRIFDWGAQHLNCRGGRVPPSRFSVLPTRFERWMIRRKRPNSSPNFGKKPLQFPAKTIFFGLYLILAKKHFNFRRRTLFCSISATELRNLS